MEEEVWEEEEEEGEGEGYGERKTDQRRRRRRIWRTVGTGAQIWRMATTKTRIPRGFVLPHQIIGMSFKTLRC